MDAVGQPDRIVGFGAFELDRRTGELRRNGLRVRVAAQGIQVLTLLLSRPGEVVTREELAQTLWPEGIHVDFENGLNAAVKKLRVALGDSGASPRYIETLPRRGYRLIVPVHTAPAAVPPTSSPRVPRGAARFARYRRTVIVALVIVAAVVLSIAYRRSPTVDRPSGPSGRGRDSTNAEANGYFRKAALFTGFGLYDPDRARQMFEHALRLDPRFGKARAEYGFLQLTTVMRGLSNDPSTLYQAEAQILQGLRDDSTFSHGHTALGALYLHMGRKDQALTEISRALRLNPREVDGRHWLAVHHMYSGDARAARQLESEDAARFPQFFPARLLLGDLAREDGDRDAAVGHYEQVLQYDPENGFVLEQLARVHMDRGEYASARATLDRLRPEERHSFRTRAIEALMLALEGRRPEAATMMDAGVVKYLEMNSLFTLTGSEFYAAMGQVSQGLDWLERAVRQGDDRADWFANNPAMASLRQEPRFREIHDAVKARVARAERPK